MKCYHCGGELERVITDLPFKISLRSIIIIKNLPLLQCKNCNEYLIEDSVMKKVDDILDNTDRNFEVGILSYAA
ncbi:MAG: YgiT-type zinc finger protein [Nitrospirota bacterium]